MSVALPPAFQPWLVFTCLIILPSFLYSVCVFGFLLCGCLCSLLRSVPQFSVCFCVQLPSLCNNMLQVEPNHLSDSNSCSHRSQFISCSVLLLLCTECEICNIHRTCHLVKGHQFTRKKVGTAVVVNLSGGEINYSAHAYYNKVKCQPAHLCGSLLCAFE